MLRFVLPGRCLRINLGGNAPFFDAAPSTLLKVGGYAPFFARFLPDLLLLNGNAPFFRAEFGLFDAF